MDENTISLIVVLCTILVAPSLTFGFLLLRGRSKRKLEIAQLKAKEAELLLEREKIRLEALREENKQLDRHISDSIEKLPPHNNLLA